MVHCIWTPESRPRKLRYSPGGGVGCPTSGEGECCRYCCWYSSIRPQALDVSSKGWIAYTSEWRCRRLFSTLSHFCLIIDFHQCNPCLEIWHPLMSGIIWLCLRRWRTQSEVARAIAEGIEAVLYHIWDVDGNGWRSEDGSDEVRFKMSWCCYMTMQLSVDPILAEHNIESQHQHHNHLTTAAQHW